MKMKYLIIFSVLLLSLTACEKVKESIELEPEANSTVQFVNAAAEVLPVLPAVPTAYDIVVDGLVANGGRRISYSLASQGGGGGNAPGYMPLLQGTRNIKLSRDSGRTSVIDVSLPFDANKAYTIVAYDTLVNGKLRVVRLNDDLTLPATGNAHVRVVHAAPNAPAVDFTFVRTSPTLDSVTIGNRSYLGANPNVDALSAFTPVLGGTAYTLKIKAAGTQTVILTASLSTALSSGRIITYYLIGTAQGRPIGLISTRHF